MPGTLLGVAAGTPRPHLHHLSTPKRTVGVQGYHPRLCARRGRYPSQASGPLRSQSCWRCRLRAQPSLHRRQEWMRRLRPLSMSCVTSHGPKSFVVRPVRWRIRRRLKTYHRKARPPYSINVWLACRPLRELDDAARGFPRAKRSHQAADELPRLTEAPNRRHICVVVFNVRHRQGA
jgi:hypothetical protein